MDTFSQIHNKYCYALQLHVSTKLRQPKHVAVKGKNICCVYDGLYPFVYDFLNLAYVLKHSECNNAPNSNNQLTVQVRGLEL